MTYLMTDLDGKQEWKCLYCGSLFGSERAVRWHLYKKGGQCRQPFWRG